MRNASTALLVFMLKASSIVGSASICPCDRRCGHLIAARLDRSLHRRFHRHLTRFLEAQSNVDGFSRFEILFEPK
jgi:hypothetical protein